MRDRRDALERFGRNLRTARLDAGISQAALARRVGISGSYVSKLEAGASECRFIAVMRLAAGLGIGIDELLDGIVWTPDPDAGGPEGRGA